MFKNFFSENLAVNEKMWKRLVQTDTPQITLYHGARALHAW